MRSSPLFAPDGMIRAGAEIEPFDDGLVHNHHWAVTANEAYPSLHRADGSNGRCASTTTPSYHGAPTHVFERHDDGLVHNHDWAVSGK